MITSLKNGILVNIKRVIPYRIKDTQQPLIREDFGFIISAHTCTTAETVLNG